MTDDKGPFEPSKAIAEMMEERWEEEWERPRGMLTDTDRRYLWDIVEYAHRQSVSERRSEIRERVVNGILDLFYLTTLEDRDQEMIIDELLEEGSGEVYDAVSTLIEFLYLGFDKDLQEIEQIVSHGIHGAEGGGSSPYEGGVKEVSVEIDIDWDWDAQAILERYESGEGYRLTPAEIGVLVREGLLDEEDIWELSRGEGGVPPLDYDEYRDPVMFPNRKWYSEDDLAGEE